MSRAVAHIWYFFSGHLQQFTRELPLAAYRFAEGVVNFPATVLSFPENRVNFAQPSLILQEVVAAFQAFTANVLPSARNFKTLSAILKTVAGKPPELAGKLAPLRERSPP